MGLDQLDNTDTLSDENSGFVNIFSIEEYIKENDIQNPSHFFDKVATLLEGKIYNLTTANNGIEVAPKFDAEIPMQELVLGMQKGFKTVKVIIDKMFPQDSYFSELTGKIIKGLVTTDGKSPENLAALLKNILGSLNSNIKLEFTAKMTNQALTAGKNPMIELSKSVLLLPNRGNLSNIFKVIHVLIHEYLHTETQEARFRFIDELVPDLFTALIGLPNLHFDERLIIFKDLPVGGVGERAFSARRIYMHLDLYPLDKEERNAESNILSGIIETKLFKMLFDRANPKPLIKFNEFIKSLLSNRSKTPSLEQINNVLNQYIDAHGFNLDQETKLFESIVRLNRAILQLSILETIHKN